MFGRCTAVAAAQRPHRRWSTIVKLPGDEKPFNGVLAPSVADSTPSRPEIVYPPPGAPNVVVVLLDDVGFGASSTFGGPIPTPTLIGSRTPACDTTSSTPPRCARRREPRC